MLTYERYLELREMMIPMLWKSLVGNEDMVRECTLRKDFFIFYFIRVAYIPTVLDMIDSLHGFPKRAKTNNYRRRGGGGGKLMLSQSNRNYSCSDYPTGIILLITVKIISVVISRHHIPVARVGRVKCGVTMQSI